MSFFEEGRSGAFIILAEMLEGTAIWESARMRDRISHIAFLLREAMKNEFKQLQKEMAKAAKKDRKQGDDDDDAAAKAEEESARNSLEVSIEQEREKYLSKQKDMPKRKTGDREKEVSLYADRLEGPGVLACLERHIRFGYF